MTADDSPAFTPNTKMYEAKDERSGMSLIALQPLVADQAFMPHMKAMYVPFHMAYSGLN